jgi:hypothetical protein
MSVCAQKVRFALAEKKLAWESHHTRGKSNLCAICQLGLWGEIAQPFNANLSRRVFQRSV